MSRSGREREGEGAPDSWLALDPEAAAVQGDDLSRESQPEAGPLRHRLRPLRGLLERVEDRLLVRGAIPMPVSATETRSLAVRRRRR